MKPLLLALLVLLGASVTRAQLVHVSLQGSPWFHGEYVSTPFHLTDDSVFTLDLYYQANLVWTHPVAAPADEPVPYGPLDPTKNFFRLQVNTPGPGGDVDVSRSLTSISLLWGSTLHFYYADYETTYEEFNLKLAFTSSVPDPATVPIPPYPPREPSQYQEDVLFFGGPDVYGENDPDSAWNYGSLWIQRETSFRAEIIPEFTPVPEPSTYAALAAAVLIGAIFRRRICVRRALA